VRWICCTALKRDQVGEDVGQPLPVQVGGQRQHGPAAQRRRAGLQQHQQHEAGDQGLQQPAVATGQHLFDHPLQQEGPEQQEHLERQRQHQDLRQRPPQPGHAADELRQPQPPALAPGREVGRRRELERDAGEVRRRLGQRHAPHAGGRVVDHQPVAAHRDQDDEVVQVPVQHARQRELGQVLELGAQRARLQLQRAGHAHQLGQGHALERQREAPPQRREVDVQAVRAGDHRQARQAALGGFGLVDQRDAGHVAAARPPNSQPTMRRRSSATEARTSIPAGSAVPATASESGRTRTR
jgi:hypothetical protein